MPNLACGRVPSPVCMQCALMQDLLLAYASLAPWGPQLGRNDRCACPPSGVTSDPCLMPRWAGHARRSKVRP